MLEGYHPLVLLLLFGYLAIWLHELTHYLLGYHWTSNQKMVYYLQIFPIGVDWGETELPLSAYRITGAAPLLLLLPSFYIMVAMVLPLLLEGDLRRAFAYSPLLVMGIPSRKDLESVIYTGRWKSE